MKKTTLPYLIIPVIAGLALVHPFAASAADDNPNDKKQQKAGSAAKAPAHVSAAVVHAPVAPVVHAPVAHVPTGPGQVAKHQQVSQNAAVAVNHTTANPAARKHVSTYRPAAATTVAGPQVVPQHNTRSVNNNTRTVNTTNTTVNNTQVSNGGGQYTRANSYGGRWTSGNNHTDWNQSQEHDWDGHHYRWYDGGWLVIDGGFWPVRSQVVVYQGGGSIMAGAQQQLANAGYYNGPIDGVAGPGTRQAILNYQDDNGLPATGHLNEPTRQALGLD